MSKIGRRFKWHKTLWRRLYVVVSRNASNNC